MPTPTPDPDAVLIAPDGCTKYLASAVDRSLAEMAPGAVLEVPCPDTATQIEIAEWCLAKGRRIRNPFEHIRVARVLVENTPAAA